MLCISITTRVLELKSVTIIGRGRFELSGAKMKVLTLHRRWHRGLIYWSSEALLERDICTLSVTIESKQK